MELILQSFFGLFDFKGAWDYLPDLLMGAVITLQLTVVVMLLSLIVGLFVALLRTSRLRLLRVVSAIYVEAIRGTPLLLQLFYIYFVLPAFGISLDPFLAAVFALTLNYSAYMSEVYRAGIQAVARTQTEAAMALGMSRPMVTKIIVLPQAIRIVVPPLGNYFLALFKDTALTSVITVHELMFTGEIIASTNFQHFTVYTIIGLIYLSLSYPGALLVQHLERRAKIGYRRKPRTALLEQT